MSNVLVFLRLNLVMFLAWRFGVRYLDAAACAALLELALLERRV